METKPRKAKGKHHYGEQKRTRHILAMSFFDHVAFNLARNQVHDTLHLLMANSQQEGSTSTIRLVAQDEEAWLKGRHCLCSLKGLLQAALLPSREQGCGKLVRAVTRMTQLHLKLLEDGSVWLESTV